MINTASLTVRRESPLDQADWNARIARLPGTGIFHTREWAAVLHDTYGFSPVYFCATEAGRTVGLLPVMEVASWATGKRGVSLPFTDHCEPSATSKNTAELLLKVAQDFGRSRGWKYIETRGGSNVLEPDATPSLSFHSHHLDLPEQPDKLIDGFDDSVRRAIRKAEKAGITLESSSSEKAIRDYYVLHCQTRRHHGLPPQPIAFFLNIQSHILNRGMGTVISARLNNRLIASAIFFLFGTESIYKFGASDRDHLPLRANNLVMWTGIQWCARQGAQVFQMGRTSLANEGLRRFKLGWGTTETRTQYFKFDLRQNTFVTDKDDTVGFHTRVFQAMPVILSRLVGSVLYRHIA